MAIHPKILAARRDAPTDEDFGDARADQQRLPYADVQPEESSVRKDPELGPGELFGSVRQVAFANSVREKALQQAWKKQDWDLLLCIQDATWWIGNRHMLNRLKYKMPAPNQVNAQGRTLLKARETPESEATGDDGTAHESDAGPPSGDTDTRSTDAAAWAKSVSRHPLLAEAAILSVLQRLYKNPSMRDRLREQAYAALEAAKVALDKDTEAIHKMLA